MKRLVVLTIFLTPLAVYSLRELDRADQPPPADFLFASTAPNAPDAPAAPDAPPAPPLPPPPPVQVEAPGMPVPLVELACDTDDETILPPNVEKIVGDPMATPDRAREEGRRRLDQKLSDWLVQAGVPRSWSPPETLIAETVRAGQIQTLERDYGEMYVPVIQADFSPDQRDRFVAAYDHDVAHRRLVLLGIGLVFFLVLLALLSGYVHADEATKGYYTNRLRALTAAGLAAGAYAAYRMLT